MIFFTKVSFLANLLKHKHRCLSNGYYIQGTKTFEQYIRAYGNGVRKIRRKLNHNDCTIQSCKTAYLTLVAVCRK